MQIRALRPSRPSSLPVLSPVSPELDSKARLGQASPKLIVSILRCTLVASAEDALCGALLETRRGVERFGDGRREMRRDEAPGIRVLLGGRARDGQRQALHTLIWGCKRRCKCKCGNVRKHCILYYKQSSIACKRNAAAFLGDCEPNGTLSVFRKDFPPSVQLFLLYAITLSKLQIPKAISGKAKQQSNHMQKTPL